MTCRLFLSFSLLFFLHLLPTTVEARNPDPLDSLVAALDTASSTSSRLLVLNELVRQSITVDPKTGFNYAEEALTLAQEQGTPAERYNAHSLFARLAALTSLRLEEGMGHVETAVQISKEELEVPRKTLSAEVMLGAYYDLLDQPDKALAIYTDAAETAGQLADGQALQSIYFNIARIYRYREDEANAVLYYHKALALNLQEGPATQAMIFAGLGAVHPNPDSAVFYLMKARQIYKDAGAPEVYLGSIADDIGNHYLGQEQYPAAIRWLEEAMQLGRSSPDSIMYFSPMFGLARALWLTNDKDRALEYALQARSFFARSPSIDNQLEVNETTANYLADAGRYEEAFLLVKQSLSLKDSVNNQRVADALAESNVRFATAAREATIAEQSLELAEARNARNRQLMIGLGLLTLLAGVFQYFFYRQRQRKAAVELALAAEARETARLRELDTMKTRFFTNVSHELRTPLTLITSPLAEALEKLKQTNLKPNLELAHRNSHQLLGLVNEMLDLAKLETGNVTPEKSTQAFEPWLRRVFYSFQSAAEGKNLSWEFNLSPLAGTKVETDFPRLEKILNNLLGNALKFTPAGGRVVLSGACSAGKLTLQVTDSGPGIPPQELPRIFDRFYQSGHLPATGGTGIGLALSRRLARLLNGDLTATSKLGEGSRFELVVPVTSTSSLIVPEEDVPRVEETTVPPPPPRGLSGVRPRLLIVEDHPEMSLYLRQSLVQEYDSVIAGNGAAALELMAKQTFDLILSDVMMPVMDGFALRQKINEVPEWAGTPFIFLTARTLEADKLRGFQLGIDDYVTKPFQLAELKARMNSLLINKTRREEHALNQEPGVDNEQQLLERAAHLVRERLDDLTFTVEEMARELGYGQRQLSRVFGRLAGLTPVQFVLEVRLQHARHLLETGQHGTVAEVRYAIGIESASYFTRKFKERFGRNPRTYFSS